VRRCLDGGADVNGPAGAQETPLYVASTMNNVAAATLLLDRGADVDWADLTDSDGDAPLHSASERGHLEFVLLLLGRGAQINATNYFLNTPLRVACYASHSRLDVLTLLLDRGAAIDQENWRGKTPLYNSCEFGRVDLARLLLHRGADIHRAASDGTSPRDAARREGYTAMAAWLARIEVVGLDVLSCYATVLLSEFEGARRERAGATGAYFTTRSIAWALTGLPLSRRQCRYRKTSRTCRTSSSNSSSASTGPASRDATTCVWINAARLLSDRDAIPSWPTDDPRGSPWWTTRCSRR